MSVRSPIRPVRARRLAAAVLRGLLLALGAFSAGCDDPAPARPVLSVFAASSLCEAFGELARAFEVARPGVEVRLSFAGSQALRLQIEQGAGADVFASADEAHVDALVESGRVVDAEVFAKNALAIITPRDNPAGVVGLASLDRAQRIVLGAPTVPVGAYTERLLKRAEARLGADFVARVRAHVVSREPNVRLVRAKVELGEADAALVYRTDALASARVHRVDLPDALADAASYAIGAVAESPRLTLARAFIAHVRSEAGEAVLRARGFEAPP